MTTPKLALGALRTHVLSYPEAVEDHRLVLRGADLCGTRHTAELVSDAMGAPVRALLSGPRGGDAQVGAMIAKRELDLVVFFWDPLASHAQ